MIVCFVTYKHHENDATQYPHMFIDIAIHGNVFEGWARVGDANSNSHYFISLSRIQSIEFWDTVGSSG